MSILIVFLFWVMKGQFFCAILLCCRPVPKIMPTFAYRKTRRENKTARARFYLETTHQRNAIMRKFLFALAIVLLVVWAIGLFVYALKGLFNIIIILAVVSFIIGMFSKRD